jgi:hypothetical protein
VSLRTKVSLLCAAYVGVCFYVFAVGMPALSSDLVRSPSRCSFREVSVLALLHNAICVVFEHWVQRLLPFSFYIYFLLVVMFG